MIIYKEKQFLVFDFEDGKTVKYDFATNTCIGKRGKPVNNLNSQLSGLTVEELCNSINDKNYADFIRFVMNQRNRYNRKAENISTILSSVPRYSKYEQFFSAGLGNLVANNLKYSINQIPKGLIKICRKYEVEINNGIVESYIDNPDFYNAAFNMEFESITTKQLFEILSNQGWRCDGTYVKRLVNNYGYNFKSLMKYIDNLVTYEGLDATGYYGVIRELYDYANMMNEISNKFDKYPRYFLSTHRIASRNYNRLKKQFEEEKFKKRIDKSMEKTFGDYTFIYPDCTQDIKDESVAMNNCVSSYINRVIEGNCHILFLRKTNTPDESLVTIEVRNNRIVQALQKYNNPLTNEQQEVVNMWNMWWEKKVNENVA